MNGRSNIFLEITGPQRFALILYFFLYRVAFPGFNAVGSPDFGPEVWTLFAAEMLYTFLLALPILFYRRNYGWLHPLILPAVLQIAIAVVRNPTHLIIPFDNPLVSFEVETTSVAISLGTSYAELATTRLNYKLVLAAALVAYYVGFFGVKRTSVPKFRFGEPRNLTLICLIGIAATAAVTAAFIAYFGGLSGLIAAMRGGRRAAFAGLGPIQDVGEFGTVIALVWFVYAKRAFFNPVFLGGLVVSLVSALLVTGSRSSLIAPLITLVLLWWWKSRKVLVGPSLGLALMALAVVGAWGAIRQDYTSSQVDWSILSLENATEWFTRASEEISKRNDEEGDVAAFAGANQEGLLLGRSYVGSILFFVPRAIWPDKPRSVDTYNMFINFAGGSIDQKLPRVGVWGIPVSPQVEAFWNFHLPGVLVIFAAFGVFHRFMESFIRAYADVPAMWVVYVYIISNFSGSALSFVSTIRDLIFLIAFLAVLGVVRFRVSPRR